MELRYAESQADAVAVLRLLLEMHKEAGRAPLSQQKVMLKIIDTQVNGAIIMAIADGGLVGSIGIDVIPWWYSEETYMQERWMFTLPQYRNLGVWPKMIEEAKRLADDSGKTFIYGRNNPARSRISLACYEPDPPKPKD